MAINTLEQQIEQVADLADRAVGGGQEAVGMPDVGQDLLLTLEQLGQFHGLTGQDRVFAGGVELVAGGNTVLLEEQVQRVLAQRVQQREGLHVEARARYVDRGDSHVFIHRTMPVGPYLPATTGRRSGLMQLPHEGQHFLNQSIHRRAVAGRSLKRPLELQQ